MVDLSALLGGDRSYLSPRPVFPSCPTQAFPRLLRAGKPSSQEPVMRRVHSDGASHRVADAKECNSLRQSELCHRGFAGLIPDAFHRRDSGEYNRQEAFSSVARSRDRSKGDCFFAAYSPRHQLVFGYTWKRKRLPLARIVGRKPVADRRSREQPSRGVRFRIRCFAVPRV